MSDINTRGQIYRVVPIPVGTYVGTEGFQVSGVNAIVFLDTNLSACSIAFDSPSGSFIPCAQASRFQFCTTPVQQFFVKGVVSSVANVLVSIGLDTSAGEVPVPLRIMMQDEGTSDVVQPLPQYTGASGVTAHASPAVLVAGARCNQGAAAGDASFQPELPQYNQFGAQGLALDTDAVLANARVAASLETVFSPQNAILGGGQTSASRGTILVSDTFSNVNVANQPLAAGASYFVAGAGAHSLGMGRKKIFINIGGMNNAGTIANALTGLRVWVKYRYDVNHIGQLYFIVPVIAAGVTDIAYATDGLNASLSAIGGAAGAPVPFAISGDWFMGIDNTSAGAITFNLSLDSLN